MLPNLIERIDWQKSGGLVPAIVQDAQTLQVLMLGFMNIEALSATLNSNEVTFFSRTKDRIWTKGESSGRKLNMKSIQIDCDQDTLLIMAEPRGPTCHTGSVSCFTKEAGPGLGFLAQLEKLIDERYGQFESNSNLESYTVALFREGLDRMAQKVGEEAIETVIAAKNNSLQDLNGEVADLFFHTLVLLRAKKSSLSQVVELLRARQGLR